MGCRGSKTKEEKKYIKKESFSLQLQKEEPKIKSAKSSDKDSAEKDENQGDLGFLTQSNLDILQAQRLQPHDVTKKLEDRWLHTHFSHAVPLRQKGVRSKRRLMSTTSNSNQNMDTHSTINSGEDPDKEDIIHTFTILHFNDVYEILERPDDSPGGAARFATLFTKKISEELEKTGERPIVLFSGDCLNPSILSCATQGTHMIDVFNYLGVDIAVFGNHDFDFGVEHACKCCTIGMDSIWLLANVEDRFTNTNLADAISYHIVTRSSGLKIGFMGLVEEEWLDTLATVKKEDIDYTDFVAQAKSVAAELIEHGVTFIIALTHMRWPNDIRLAQEVPEIDFIFGGHDHDYEVNDVEECLIIKSGSDFRTFTSVEVYVTKNESVDAKMIRYDVPKQVAIDPGMNEVVQSYMKLLENSLDTCIGTIGIELDGRYAVMRTREARLGNFAADIVATATKADVVLINSGSFRSDGIHHKGNFKLSDLMTILPIVDTVVSVQITGEQLLEAFENGVSKYPKHEGRFPQISGASFGFDPEAPPGKRIIRETVRIGTKSLNLNRSYHLATKAYIARGKDGYTSLGKCKLLSDPDASPLLSTVVRNHMANIQKVLNFEKEMNCKVSISPDGKNIGCDCSYTNISQVFSLERSEAPTPLLYSRRETNISKEISLKILLETTPVIINRMDKTLIDATEIESILNRKTSPEVWSKKPEEIPSLGLIDSSKDFKTLQNLASTVSARDLDVEQILKLLGLDGSEVLKTSPDLRLSIIDGEKNSPVLSNLKAPALDCNENQKILQDRKPPALDGNENQKTLQDSKTLALGGNENQKNLQDSKTPVVDGNENQKTLQDSKTPVVDGNENQKTLQDLKTSGVNGNKTSAVYGNENQKALLDLKVPASDENENPKTSKDAKTAAVDGSENQKTLQDLKTPALDGNENQKTWQDLKTPALDGNENHKTLQDLTTSPFAGSQDVKALQHLKSSTESRKKSNTSQDLKLRSPEVSKVSTIPDSTNPLFRGSSDTKTEEGLTQSAKYSLDIKTPDFLRKRLEELSSVGEIKSPRPDIKYRKLGHLPKFIAIDVEFDTERKRNDIEEKIYQLRKAARNIDKENATLLQERAQNPEDLRWQITPLLEARIFHCTAKDFNS